MVQVQPDPQQGDVINTPRPPGASADLAADNAVYARQAAEPSPEITEPMRTQGIEETAIPQA